MQALHPVVICPSKCVSVTTRCLGDTAEPISTLMRLSDEDCTHSRHPDTSRLLKGESPFTGTAVCTTPSRTSFPELFRCFLSPPTVTPLKRATLFFFLRCWLWKSNKCHGDEIPTQFPYSVVQSQIAADLLFRLWSAAWECLPITLTC